MDQARLTRSMSKKACTPDNEACEGFFPRLKNEMCSNRTWHGTSMQEFIGVVDRYIRRYSQKRIKVSLGGPSPAEYRQACGGLHDPVQEKVRTPKGSDPMSLGNKPVLDSLLYALFSVRPDGCSRCGVGRRSPAAPVRACPKQPHCDLWRTVHRSIHELARRLYSR